ncbi:MAG: acetoin:2,6-dichlorophenolindophenol oxidoreductase subunit alpha [Peptococcaceae bacterium BICA1-8]|nr:MAG: acetoin:2,6-dichlorophenolindophenol oxidoreductase subunit alpha [Peptococcaceae bacterium BICA1-8]
MAANKELVLKMYEEMLKIRLFEEATIDVYQKGLMPGLAHPYLGEEAIAVGACTALENDDFITSTHRGHGHLMAKGGDMKKMMAEIMGKKTGYCKGKGGSMHIADVSLGILGANGIVGAGLPIAVGSALSSKRKNNNKVTACFFGDGASNQGTFHEALNMASIWKLPVVFVCENNQYGYSTAISKHIAIENISDRAISYGFPGITVDGNDVEEVYEAVKVAVERARKGEGPTLIECKSYRWTGHSVGDPGTAYRTREEVTENKAKCPIIKYGKKLVENGLATEENLNNIKSSVQEMVKEAVEYAIASPLPDENEIYQDLYV